CYEPGYREHELAVSTGHLRPASVATKQCFRDRKHVAAVGDRSSEPALIHSLAAERFPFGCPIVRPVKCGNQKLLGVQRVRRFSQQSRDLLSERSIGQYGSML